MIIILTKKSDESEYSREVSTPEDMYALCDEFGAGIILNRYISSEAQELNAREATIYDDWIE